MLFDVHDIFLSISTYICVYLFAYVCVTSIYLKSFDREKSTMGGMFCIKIWSRAKLLAKSWQNSSKKGKKVMSAFWYIVLHKIVSLLAFK